MVVSLAVVGFYCAVMSIFEGLTGIDLLPGPGPDGLRQEGGSMRTNGPFWCPGVEGQYLSWILLLVMYRWRLRRLPGFHVGRCPWLQPCLTRSLWLWGCILSCSATSGADLWGDAPYAICFPARADGLSSWQASW